MASARLKSVHLLLILKDHGLVCVIHSRELLATLLLVKRNVSVDFKGEAVLVSFWDCLCCVL